MWISCLLLLLVDLGNVPQVQSFQFLKNGLAQQRNHQQRHGWIQRIRAGEINQQQTDSHSSALHATTTVASPPETAAATTRSPLTMLITSIKKLFQGIWGMFRGKVTT